MEIKIKVKHAHGRPTDGGPVRPRIHANTMALLDRAERWLALLRWLDVPQLAYLCDVTTGAARYHLLALEGRGHRLRRVRRAGRPALVVEAHPMLPVRLSPLAQRFIEPFGPPSWSTWKGGRR